MSFRLANLDAAHTPLVDERPVANGEEFSKGALLLVNASGEYEECGADPDDTGVAAVALSGYGPLAQPFFTVLGRDGFPPGRMQGVSVKDRVLFLAKYTGSKPAAPDGTAYGVAVVNDEWVVDFTDTANPVVEYVKDLAEENLGPVGDLVGVVFVPAAVQPLG